MTQLVYIFAIHTETNSVKSVPLFWSFNPSFSYLRVFTAKHLIARSLSFISFLPIIVLKSQKRVKTQAKNWIDGVQGNCIVQQIPQVFIVDFSLKYFCWMNDGILSKIPLYRPNQKIGSRYDSDFLRNYFRKYCFQCYL